MFIHNGSYRHLPEIWKWALLREKEREREREGDGRIKLMDQVNNGNKHVELSAGEEYLKDMWGGVRDIKWHLLPPYPIQY